MLKKIIYNIKSIFNSLLAIFLFRYLIGLIRFQYFKIFRGIKVYYSPHMQSDTISHNYEIFKHIRTDFLMNRIKFLYGPISAIEKININSRILLIGSRTENEILYLNSFGHRNIKAVDLISYSPLIETQDMHNLNFNDSEFDLVILGWTIRYSNNVEKCAQEIIRVLKNNALVAIGHDKTQATERINSLKDIHDLFGTNFYKSYFNYDAELSSLSRNEICNITGFSLSHILTVFSVKK